MGGKGSWRAAGTFIWVVQCFGHVSPPFGDSQLADEQWAPVQENMRNMLKFARLRRVVALGPLSLMLFKVYVSP